MKDQKQTAVCRGECKQRPWGQGGRWQGPGEGRRAEDRLWNERLLSFRAAWGKHCYPLRLRSQHFTLIQTQWTHKTRTTRSTSRGRGRGAQSRRVSGGTAGQRTNNAQPAGQSANSQQRELLHPERASQLGQRGHTQFMYIYYIYSSYIVYTQGFISQTCTPHKFPHN